MEVLLGDYLATEDLVDARVRTRRGSKMLILGMYGGMHRETEIFCFTTRRESMRTHQDGYRDDAQMCSSKSTICLSKHHHLGFSTLSSQLRLHAPRWGSGNETMTLARQITNDNRMLARLTATKMLAGHGRFKRCHISCKSTPQ